MLAPVSRGRGIRPRSRLLVQKQWTLSQTDGFNEILDVRSPEEYACDHIPGAVNYPVLDDAERARIGRLYKKVSPLEARKQGAGLVASRISGHIERHFKSRGGDWAPLVYCWRGGTRSGAMTYVLNSIGWRAEQLPGGYKSYRRAVIRALEETAPRLRLRVLCGPTGVGKSRLLQALHQCRAQVLDLERIANHRGSVLGEPVAGGQPSQKWFESLVCEQMRRFDPSLPVYVEAESRKIGRVQVPAPLIEAIRQAECVRIEAAVEQRVAFLIAEYRHFIDSPAQFEQALHRLKPYQGKAQIDEWCRAFKGGDVAGVVADLINRHYDPFYRRSLKKHFRQRGGEVSLRLEGTEARDFLRAANRIIEGSATDENG